MIQHLDPLQSLAATRLMQHIRFMRNLRSGKAMPLRIQRGRPGNNHNQYDARTVQYIDTERALSSIRAPELGWLVQHIVDDVSINQLAADTGHTVRMLDTSIRCSLTIFADELLKRDWL